MKFLSVGSLLMLLVVLTTAVDMRGKNCGGGDYDLDIEKREDTILMDDIMYDKEQFAKRGAIKTNKWETTIYFTLPCNTYSSSEYNNIIAGMAEIESKTCLRFRYRINENPYLKYIRGSGCWSWIGRSRSGAQDVSIGRGCAYKGIVTHEVMHALGWHHEQTRPDRDSYVTINFQNIQGGMEHNFKKIGNNWVKHSAYDYDSVMHYGKTAFSKNRQPTIVPKGNPNRQLGQRNGLSSLDADAIKQVYCPSNPPPNPCAKCTSTQICQNNKCVPKPCQPSTCASRGLKCGTHSNGCNGQLNCGSCPNGQNCDQARGQCVAVPTTGCSPNCHSKATCRNRKCVCRDGYEGNGLVCKPKVIPPPPTNNDWEVVLGSANSWTGLQTTNKRVNSQSHQIARSKSSINNLDKNGAKVTVSVKPTGNANAGPLVFLEKLNTAIGFYRTTNQDGYVALYMNNRFIFKMSLRRKVYSQNLGIKLSTRGDALDFVDNGRLVRSLRYSKRFLGEPKALGLFNYGGNAEFSSIYLSSARRMSMPLQGCFVYTEIQERVGKVMGKGRVEGVQGNGASSKCEAPGNFPGDPVPVEYGDSFTFDVVAEDVSASSLTTDLADLAASDSAQLRSLDLQTNGATEQVQVTGNVPGVESLQLEVPPEELGIVSAPKARGLSVGAIGGITAASVAVVGLMAVGGGYVALKVVNRQTPGQEEEMAPEKTLTESAPNPLFKSGSNIKGVNVYDFEPGKIQSITARSPAQPINP